MDQNNDDPPVTMSAIHAEDMLAALLAVVTAGLSAVTGAHVQPMSLAQIIGQRLDDFLSGQLSAQEATSLIGQDASKWLFQRGSLVGATNALSSLEVEVLTLLKSYQISDGEGS